MQQPKDNAVNGKPTTVGQAVCYTDSNGRQHDATIVKLDGDKATLSATIDGERKNFTAVPHSPAGSGNTWDHKD